MNRLNAKVVLVDDGREPDEFWTAIGGKKPIKEAAEVRRTQICASICSNSFGALK